MGKSRGHRQAANTVWLQDGHPLGNGATQRFTHQVGAWDPQHLHQPQRILGQHLGCVGRVGCIGATYAAIVKRQDLEFLRSKIKLWTPRRPISAGISTDHHQPVSLTLNGVVHRQFADLDTGHKLLSAIENL